MSNLVVSFLVKLVNQTVAPAAKLVSDVSKIGKTAKAATPEVAGVGKALDGIPKPAQSAAKAVGGVSDSMKSAEQPTQDLGQKVDDAGAAMKRTDDRASQLGQTIGHKLVQAMSLGVTAFLSYETVAVGFIGSLLVWTHNQAVAADATRKAAQIANISADSYQRLQYALDVSTNKSVDLGKVLTGLQQKMFQTAAGNKQSAAAFQAIGVKVRDARGHYKAVDIVLGQVADGLAKMRAGVARTSVVTTLFGESGAALLPLLTQGSKALKSLGDQAQTYGLILTDKTLTASQKMDAIWQSMTYRVQGLGLQLFTGLLPPMTDLISKIATIIDQNRADILKGMTTGLNWLSSNMPKILDATGKFATFLKDTVSISTKVITAVGGIGNVFDIIAVAAATTWTYSLITATAAIWGFNGALYAFPGTWIIAGIAAVAVGAYLLIRHWKSVSTFFVNLWHGITDVFGKAIKWISDHFMSFPLPLKLLALPAVIIAHWKDISGFFGRVFGFIGRVWTALPWWAQGLINLPATIITHWSAIWSVFSKGPAGITEAFGKAIKWISDHFMSFPLPLKLLALPAVIIDHWKDISGFFGRVFGFVGRIWNALPWWAQGLINLPATIITHWSTISAWFGKVMTAIAQVWKGLPWWAQAMISLPMTIISHWQAISTGFGKIWSGITAAFQDGVQKVWNALPDWFKTVLKAGAFVVRFVTGGPDLTPKDQPKAPPPAPRPGLPPMAVTPGKALALNQPRGPVLGAPASAPAFGPARSVANDPMLKPAAFTEQPPVGGRVEVAITDERVRVKKVESSPGTSLFVDRGFAFG